MPNVDQDSRIFWVRLLRPWEKLDDDNPPTWRKDCGFFIAFITQGEHEFEFELHGGDDEVLIDVNLSAVTLTEAQSQSDELIAKFVRIGAGVLATNEIRLVQAFTADNTIFGVGEDGCLYKNTADGWIQVSMRLHPHRTHHVV